MKLIPVQKVLMLCGAFALISSSVSANEKIEALNKRLAQQKEAPSHGLAASHDIERSEKKIDTTLPEPSMLERCEFLTDGNVSIILPKGAIIHMPEQSTLSVGQEIFGGIVDWESFFVQNRARIQLVALSEEQLKGAKPIDPAVIAKIEEAKQIAITSFQGRPVALASHRNR